MPVASPRRVVFRTDSSGKIGSGHVMRCLALASSLRAQAFRCHFVCYDLPGALTQSVANLGFDLTILKGCGTDPQFEDVREIKPLLLSSDFLIVDHYGLDKIWEKEVSNHVSGMMVIDDLANRPHYADLLLDQNLLPARADDYRTLVSTNCELLLGPKYALLRPEFGEFRKRAQQRSGVLNRLLIFFGASDITGETEKVLKALQLLQRPLHVDVVTGFSNSSNQQIRALCAEMGINFHCQTSELGELILGADFCLGAGGSSVWERACLGLPSAVVAVSDIQVEVSQYCHVMGIHRYLGSHLTTTPDGYLGLLEEYFCHPEHLRQMSTTAWDICDGLGAERVVKKIVEVMDATAKAS